MKSPSEIDPIGTIAAVVAVAVLGLAIYLAATAPPAHCCPCIEEPRRVD